VGWSQAELAARAQTSQPTLSAYENGHRTPSIATLERLLGAMGLSLAVASWTPPEERKSRALHRAIVARIAADPELALVKARRNLQRLRRADSEGHASGVLDEWAGLLDGPIEPIILAMLADDPWSEHLATSSPFAGLLTPRERWAVLRRFREQERPDAA